MGPLRALVLVILSTAVIAGSIDRPQLQRHRTSKMTRVWRQNNGLGSFNDVGTAGGSSLAKPQVLECTEAGYFPQPGSCTSFYRCVDWLGTGAYFSTFRFNCPYGTVFDDDLDICNHPGAVINPPECSGAMGDFPLPEPPGVDATTGSGGQTSNTGGSGTSSPGDDTEPCEGTLAPYPTPETTLSPIPDVTILGEVEETTYPLFFETTTAGNMWEVDASSLYACPAPGYYPFEGDCVRFYKCVETVTGTLKGLLYKCPIGYGYSEERQRCWREEELSPCQRQPQEAHQRFESATQIYPEDLLWFFSNKK